MKEIIRIHLALTPYNIELAAHKLLEDYLDAIKQELHADEDAMREIEARIAELLAERGVAAERVITMADVKAIQKQLGDPKEFADDTDTSTEMPVEKPRKRLLRDLQHAMLGGVCAGIAAYFDVSYAFVRVLAVIASVASFGIAVPLYVVLWLIVPAAETAADRLKMAGELVTLETLRTESASGKAPVLQPPLLKILRVGLGVVFSLVTFLVLVAAVFAVGYLIKSFAPENISMSAPYEISISLLFTFGIVLLAMFCALLTYMLLRDAFRRKLLIALTVTAILGMGIYCATIIVSSLYSRSFQQRIDNPSNTQAILKLGTKVDGIKSIETRSKGITLTYVVSDDMPSAEYSYNSSMINEPNIKITRLGDVLVVDAEFKQGTLCRREFRGCAGLTVNVTIKGPALERIKTNSGYVLYEALEQPTLSIEQSSGSAVEIKSIGTLDTLNISAIGGITVYANEASINIVNINAQYGDYSFASLSMLSVKQPSEKCGKSMAVAARHISTITYNDAPWQQDTACFELTVTDR